MKSPGGAGHCCCLAGPTLELFAEDELIATVGVHHGHGIRWIRWRPDAALRSDAISEWFIRNGIDARLLTELYKNPFVMARPPVEKTTQPLSHVDQKLLLAEVLAARHALEEAEVQCSDLLRDDPERAVVYAARASIRKRRGNLKGTDADLLNALRFGGPDAELLFKRGVTLDELGRGTEAETMLTEALALQPAHAGALNSRSANHRRRATVACPDCG